MLSPIPSVSRRKPSRTRLVLAAAVLAFAGASQALGQGPTAAGSFYAFASGGGFFPQGNDQLQRERNSLGNFMVGGGYAAAPNFLLEGNILLSGHRLDTPPGGSPPAGTFAAGTEKSRIGTAGLAASAKYRIELGSVSPYFGGGVGVYSTRFVTTTEANGCTQNCEDTGPRVTERSTDLGYHAFAGVDIHVTTKDTVLAELRALLLRAELPSVVSGKIDAGGTFLWLGYRRSF